jgi:hypothetical protein
VSERGEVNETPYAETGILLAIMNGEHLRAQGLMDEMTNKELRALETWAISLEEMAYATQIKKMSRP